MSSQHIDHIAFRIVRADRQRRERLRFLRSVMLAVIVGLMLWIAAFALWWNGLGVVLLPGAGLVLMAVIWLAVEVWRDGKSTINRKEIH